VYFIISTPRTIKLLSELPLSTPVTMEFIWGEATRFLVTLLASIIGLAAVLLIPGRRRLEGGDLGSYLRRGRWVVYLLGLLVLLAAAGLGYEWARLGRRDLWVTGNLLLLSLLGASVLAGNAWTVRRIRRLSSSAEAVEVVEVVAEEPGDTPEAPETRDMDDPSAPPPPGMKDEGPQEEASDSPAGRDDGARARGTDGEPPD